MDTLHFKFEEIVSRTGHAARQLRMLYEAAAAIDTPTIVELGTDRGRSTTCLLTACEARSGRLVSIDIKDCSHLTDSPLVTFVHADAADVAAALAKAPWLRDGIDLLYVDALHTPERVRREVEAWFPLLKAGGLAFFDDVDPTPYRRGGRKDSWGAERNLEGIASYLRELFNANAETLELSMTYGSTGLGRMRKLSAQGVPLNPPRPTPRRPWFIRGRLALGAIKSAAREKLESLRRLRSSRG